MHTFVSVRSLTLLALIDVRGADLAAQQLCIGDLALGDNRGLIKLFVVDAGAEGGAAVGPAGADEFVYLECARQCEKKREIRDMTRRPALTRRISFGFHSSEDHSDSASAW